MLIIFNLLTSLLASLFLFFSINRVLKGNYSILHVCHIAFYAMHVVPLLVEVVLGVENVSARTPYLYAAMTDTYVGLIYCAYVLVASFALLFIAEKYASKRAFGLAIREKTVNGRLKPSLKYLFYFCMFALPLIAVFLAPAPKVYLKFAYFYRYAYDPDGSIRLFHLSEMKIVKYVIFVSLILIYLYKDRVRARHNFDIYLAVFIMTWLDQKRTMLTFALLGILVIDIIKGYYSRRQFICKAVFFVAIVFGYFYFYRVVTGKGSDSSFLNDYTLYYSRMNCVKLAIYDKLYMNKMLNYSGESILYDLFFFVPRGIWPSKPVLFQKYFTSFAVYGVADQFLSWGLQVNLWSEFIANFGIILGAILSIAFVSYVALLCEKNHNFFVKISGILFLCMYTMFGFSSSVQIIYIIMVGLLCLTKLRRKNI